MLERQARYTKILGLESTFRRRGRQRKTAGDGYIGIFGV